MEKRDKRKLSVVLVFGLFLLPILISLVSAQVSPVIEKPTEFIKTWFTQWQGGNLDLNVAKFLFFVLIAFIVYSVLAAMNFPPQNAIRWILSAIVSFLATAFITPKEVFSMLTAYTALGLTLGVILPFIIILLFSIESIRSKQPFAILIQIVVWWMFVAFLIYKLIVGMVTKQADPWINVVIGIAALIAFIIAIANKSIRRSILKIEIEAGEEASARGASKIKEGLETAAGIGETTEKAGRHSWVPRAAGLPADE